MANSAQCQNCTRRACQDKYAFHYPNSHERIAEVVFASGACHFTANDIHGKLESNRANISLEAVNDTLLCLTKRGKLRQLPQFSSQPFYDTNIRACTYL
ncbi:transcriptional repressor [Mesorhizobium sp. L48C026A00]|uniref:transcriptional repressor n=1 Tax=Mesorhizobium sp. L48C026A00 TaxID=1287182 RepID=UPI0012ECB431